MLGYVAAAGCYAVSGLIAVFAILATKGLDLSNFVGIDALFACFGGLFLTLTLAGGVVAALGRALLRPLENKFSANRSFEAPAYSIGLTIFVIVFAVAGSFSMDREINWAFYATAVITLLQALLSGICYSLFVEEDSYVDTERIEKYIN